MKKNKILIVGAGITGITLAERFASMGNEVLIIDKREHIGGNCYDYKNEDGILIHKYGYIFFIQIIKMFGSIFHNLLIGFTTSTRF